MDMIPGANPADALKEIQAELQSKFDEAGMGKVSEFTDKLDDLLAKVKEGPQEIMEMAKEKFAEFKTTLQEKLDDPASLAPGGGAIAACASWYGKSVASKLGKLNEEAGGLVDSVKQIGGDIKEPLEKLSETLQDAMSKLESSLKSLAKLPETVMEAINGKESAEDVATIDTAPMKASLAGGDVDEPLGAISGLKDVLNGAIAAVRSGIETLKDFITSAPDMVKDAFNLPAPLTCATPCALSQAPQAMQDLLAMVDKLKEVKLDSIIDIFEKTTDTIGNLDVDAVKEPVKKFLESAGGLVDKLDKTVTGAKVANNPAGAAGAAMGALFGR